CEIMNLGARELERLQGNWPLASARLKRSVHFHSVLPRKLARAYSSPGTGRTQIHPSDKSASTRAAKAGCRQRALNPLKSSCLPEFRYESCLLAWPPMHRADDKTL